MPDISEKFVVVTVTKPETRVWATGISKGSIPEKIFAPAGQLKSCTLLNMKLLNHEYTKTLQM